MSIEDRIKWNDRYRKPKTKCLLTPRKLLLDHKELLPSQGTALELAMGLGHSAGFLLSHGLSVVGIDCSSVAVRMAKQRYPKLMAVVADLPQFYIPSNHFDVIVNFYYLERKLWEELQRTLKPGGLLFFETLTQPIQKVRKNISPEYLLREKELLSFFKDWEIVFYQEGWVPSKHGKEKAIASLIARSPKE